MGAKSTKRKKKQEQNIDTMEQHRNEPYNSVTLSLNIIRAMIEARRQLVSSYTTGQEKCYDPRDRTLTFVDGDDDLDCK